jgi:hypothetical protein
MNVSSFLEIVDELHDLGIDFISARETIDDHISDSLRRCEIAGIFEYGESVAANCLLAGCYAMEYIEGTAVKLRAVEQLVVSRKRRALFTAPSWPTPLPPRGSLPKTRRNSNSSTSPLRPLLLRRGYSPPKLCQINFTER